MRGDAFVDSCDLHLQTVLTLTHRLQTMSVDFVTFSHSLQKQTNEVSNSAAFTAETNPVMWSLLTNTIPHGLTMMSMVTPATEESMKAGGHFTKIFDPGKNGVQLSNESKRVIFPIIIAW